MSAATITNEDVQRGVTHALRRSYAWMKGAVDYLRATYGWGERKASNVWYGRGSTITAADLLNLMATNDEFYRWVLQTTGRDAEHEPWKLTEAQRRAMLEILKGHSDDGIRRN